jgi:hypothetical protein
MAKKKRDNDLFDHLRARGVRKRVAKAIASRGGKSAKGRRKAESVARGAITDLRSAADAIIHRDAKKRSQAAKKAARTRKRNAETARRSTAARKGARTRARAGSR